MPRRGWKSGFEGHFIAMSPQEREHLAFVEQALPNLGELVGPRCLELLRSGRKLELEGAANPVAFSKAFRIKLLRHLASASPNG